MGVVEKSVEAKDTGSTTGEWKGQEQDSSQEEEEFWDFDDSDDDACSYCRTCQLRRRLEKRLAAKKMLNQLEANEDHIRRVKEDGCQVQPREDHRSIEDLLRFIGEDSGGENDKRKSKAGVSSSKKSSSKSNKKKDKGRKKQSCKSNGETNKSKTSSEGRYSDQTVPSHESKGEDSWSGHSSSSLSKRTNGNSTFVETSRAPKSIVHISQGDTSSYSNAPVLDKDLEDWEADIEAEVEAFRKRLEELSAPLKNKPKIGAFPQLSSTYEQSLRSHRMGFHKANENSSNSRTRSVGIL
ncbi:uncharacterized protein Gasu_29060 [Galdieria sulphuraria]|uniref:Uncharacterized protein n=1 Tax=Galdieria sulphuraria TaxID=130081 RepID=M2Y181_GALSU|nr:uncharacterized protein Gasu_29060 [Galdieria sulphuraria]EME29683.1 hypothetical protein Gasu_29060 [Galdieria sulphuraria]|eukprot:XP_005706203.1 hypothetical protein Gasu_29060 [Galdieria sulphuraria]